MLEIEGSVEITLDDRKATLSGHRNQIELDLADSSCGFISGSLYSRFKRATLFALYLYRIGLTLSVSYRGRQAALLGRGANSGMLGRLLGLHHIEIRLRWSAVRLLFG